MLNLVVYFNTACWYYKLLDLFINVFLGKKGPPEYKCNKKLRHIYRILFPIVRAQLISNPWKKRAKTAKMCRQKREESRVFPLSLLFTAVFGLKPVFECIFTIFLTDWKSGQNIALIYIPIYKRK
jgi:hypothetical protein